MAKAVLVTYLFALSIILSTAYKQECAVGPEYWCKSFQTAEDCGALRHCTDTVWRYDEKPTKVDSSTTCEWCQKILEFTHRGIQHLANNEDLIRQSLAKDCKKFPLANVESKCTNALEKYGKSIGSLMKYNRYATVCRLMNICSIESIPEISTTEKPKTLGHGRCTWGPSYWCSSLSNTRECGSIDHCSNKVWSQQTIEKKSNDNLCQYCEFTIEKLRIIIQNNKTEITVEKWLSGACSMLPTKDAIDECIQMMSQYAEEILVLIQTNIDPGVICHLAHMCKDATVLTRVNIINKNPEPIKDISMDEQSIMLCNAIVEATHELQVNQKKNRDEIQIYLQNDCQKLTTIELINKCENLVDKHGIEIHGHVASNIDLSKICHYISDFTDHSSLQTLPKIHCEVCAFVLSVAKYMIDGKHAEDKVLNYIDEQICSRLTGSLKTNCKKIIETQGKDLINDIECGTKSMLLCTRFQVCIDEVISSTSSIEKNEKNTYLKENICDHLGTFKEICNALIDKDSIRLMRTLINDIEGENLCRIFGICPQKMSLLDNLSINDDKNKCQRCIDDFTRRKHIAEKLINYSSEFLYHLCGQLPQKDDCTKTVNDSINELLTFVRSLDPQDICLQLKYCDKILLKEIQSNEINLKDDFISFEKFLKKDSFNCTLCKLAFETIKKAVTTNKTEQEIIQYIKTNICSKLETFTELCDRTIEIEGPEIFSIIAKDINPKQACEIMGICSGSSSFENCNDKCECCMDKIEIHEVQIATFLKEIVENIKNLCQHMPENEKCLEMTKKFDENLNKITSNFNSKKVCQLLNHCSSLPIEIETLSQCQIRIDSKKQFLLSTITTINQNLKSLCEYIPWNKNCYSIIDRSTLDINEKLLQLNSQIICTTNLSLSNLICIKNNPFENLCQQLITFNENNLHIQTIFQSMFNQNGNFEKDLCQYQSKNDCQNSSLLNLEHCSNKCDCCVEFYTRKTISDLNIIESLRTGLLATCDWSLSKDYCIPWFNRVCDRMKDKMNQFIPTTFCKQIDLCSIEQDNECKFNGDKCKCCTNQLNSRQKRFHTTVNEVTYALLSLCNTDNDCRSFVQSIQQQTIDQINKINSQIYCQRYGYCLTSSTLDTSRVMINAVKHIGSSIEGLDDRFEAALTSDICFQYGQLRPMCEHLMASSQGHRYAYVYMTLLKNNPKLVDDDLREQMKTNVNTNVCDSCKNAVQSSKDFWNNALESVRNALLRTCERCPVKQQCQDYYNRRFDNIKSYIDSIDPNKFCQSLHLCSTSAIIIIQTDKCSTCVDRLQVRKDGILQAIHRISLYFDDICQRFANKQCQVFIKQIENSFEESIQNFNPKQICTSIGFCSLNQNDHELDFDTYEKYLENNLEQNLCSTLGPFENLCKQVIQGNRKQIQTVKINYNIKDLMQIGEEMKNGMTRNYMSAVNLGQCDSDKCQCCIDRVNQKKDILKNRGDKVIAAFNRSCVYCPVKNKCQKYFQDYQTKFDAYINDIDAKQVCTRLGFCNVSTLCANMGSFQQACEEALTAFTQSIEYDSKTFEEHLPHTSVVVLPTKIDAFKMDSNSTCILCEYMMKILANYIHQKSTEDEIEQNLKKVCNQMPATLEKQCHELIDNYGPPIIAILIEDFDVSTICHKLNLCTNQMKVQLSHITQANQAACSVCDYFSTYIHFALKRDSSEESLKHALATVCTHLSSEQMSQCHTLVQLFSPNIRKLELQLGNNFCKDLTICQTSSSSNEKSKEIKPTIIHVPLIKVETTKENNELKNKIINNLDDTPQCTLCHYVVTYLDAVLKTNKSEAAVEAALEKVCTILPSKERAQCHEFVKTYGPVLAELVSELADPNTVCRYLGVCQVTLPKETTTKKPTPITYPNHDYVRIKNEQSPITCTICQFVIGRMKHYLTENQTEEEILVSLKKSCDLFSVIDYKQKCEDFLDQYSSYIIQMISSDVQPKVACQSLGICVKDSESASSSSSSSTPPVPVSSSTTYGKCIFGMSYWCTSRQNAELCNAVELCENQVWSKKNKNIII